MANPSDALRAVMAPGGPPLDTEIPVSGLWMGMIDDEYYLVSMCSPHMPCYLWWAPAPDMFSLQSRALLTMFAPEWHELATEDGFWGPQLHTYDGTTYMLCAFGHGDNRRIQAYKSRSDNLHLEDNWRRLGVLKGMPDRWATDPTIFTNVVDNKKGRHADGKRYIVWSAHPMPDPVAETHVHEDPFAIVPIPPPAPPRPQCLFIAEMNGMEVLAESVKCISMPFLDWEDAQRDDGIQAINEAPAYVSIGNFRGIVFSASGNWNNEYKLGVLELIDPRNPLEPRSWRKKLTPLIMNRGNHDPPYMPGHASFIPSQLSNKPNHITCVFQGARQANEPDPCKRSIYLMEMKEKHFASDADTLCCVCRGDCVRESRRSSIQDKAKKLVKRLSSSSQS